MANEITPLPPKPLEAVETGEGVFLVDAAGNVIEWLQGSDEACITCHDPDCDFDCDGPYTVCEVEP